LILVPQHFGCTVFDRRTSRYLPFDQPATSLLRALCERPIDALEEEAPSADAAQTLRDFFEQFEAVGFFTLDGRFAGSILDVAVPRDYLVGPLAVHLEVVAACNLHCTHCFAGELPRREQPLTLAELDQFFGALAALGSFRLGLTGGEPTLRRDLFDVIDLATGHGLHPCLTTNGLTMTEDLAREFGKRELVWLNVSLDGASSATNDRVRGAGTFDRVVERLKVLEKHARFTLAFTLMRTNREEVEACAELAARVGASTAVFRPLYPVGVARDHLDDLMPDFHDYHDAVQRLSAWSARQSALLRGVDPFGPLTRRDHQSIIHNGSGCGAGQTVCSVSVSGDVNPCSFLGAGFADENILARPFREIWERGHQFRSLRALQGGTAETFSGGCRARALTFNGSVNAPDPWVAARHDPDASRGSYEAMDIVQLSVGRARQEA
jgi:MoaA/NifB/PqqE/SkfB family radical SAM enzyme